MAETTTANPNWTAGAGTDPVSTFWRDLWTRVAAAGQSAPGMNAGAAAPFMTPEAVKKMQAAFYDAMAQYAEQYMRSPQFLEAMKKSMDQAMALRRQMDGFLKQNMATAFDTASGGSHAEILTAIRQSAAQTQEKLDRIEQRVAALEEAQGVDSGVKPRKKPAAKTAAKKNGKR